MNAGITQAQLEELETKLATANKQAKNWERDAKLYARNAGHYQDKLATTNERLNLAAVANKQLKKGLAAANERGNMFKGLFKIENKKRDKVEINLAERDAEIKRLKERLEEAGHTKRAQIRGLRDARDEIKELHAAESAHKQEPDDMKKHKTCYMHTLDGEPASMTSGIFPGGMLCFTSGGEIVLALSEEQIKREQDASHRTRMANGGDEFVYGYVRVRVPCEHYDTDPGGDSRGGGWPSPACDEAAKDNR